MTYLHIHDQGLRKHALGERRSDAATAENIHDALRAHGLRAAAQAMEFQEVDMAVALRVLVEPGRRRGQMGAFATASARGVPDTQYAELAGFAAVPA